MVDALQGQGLERFGTMNLHDEMKAHLTEKLLPFWESLRDNTRGGFYGWMDSGLTLDRDAVKGCILNNRILWFFSNAYLTLGDEKLKAYADHAYDFLVKHCYDPEQGGVYWSLDADGAVVDSTKHTYNQAFAVYALSSYYRAFGKKEALELAGKIVDVIEGKCFDEYGYKEAQDRYFVPVENDKLSENGVMADRTMNTLLHVLEGYTEYYLVTKEERVGAKLRWMLDVLADKIYHPVLHRQEVFFDNDMHSLIDLHSYGHDIETSWLADRTLKVLDDPAYTAKLRPILLDLADQIYRVAYKKHSLANECERGKVDERRIWWVQAEAVLGFYNAWERSGEARYRDAALDVWDFIKTYLVDRRPGGEWFYNVDEDGRPEMGQPIVEPWKCPYHNGRLCMEMMRRTDPGLKA